MNPALLRELDAEGAAIVRMIDDIPRGREYDMAGHMDAKRAAMRRLERLMKRVREEAGSPRAVVVDRGEKLGRPFPFIPRSRRP